METQPSQTRPSAPSLLPPPPSQAAALASAGVPLVFTGSSEKDVALAKSFWNSVTLQPPLESRLSPRRGSGVSGSTTSSRRASSTNNPNGPGKHDISAQLTLDKKKEERIQGATEAEKSDMKEQYLKKAKKREDIISLLKKQREERIRKESFSNLNKSRTKLQESKVQLSASDLEEQESVKALN